MNKPWPTVKLGKVLKQDVAFKNAVEPREYKKLSVKLCGKGVVLDGNADGATARRSTTLSQPVCRSLKSATPFEGH